MVTRVSFGSGRSYVGNIHPKVTDSLMVELFSGIGPLEGCKLIKKDKVWHFGPFGLSIPDPVCTDDTRVVKRINVLLDMPRDLVEASDRLPVLVCTFVYLCVPQSSYGFVDYYDHRSAAAALVTLNGRHLSVPLPHHHPPFL